MFNGSVENTSGLTMETFFPALLKQFSDLDSMGWLLFVAGVLAFLFIHHGIPYLAKKAGLKGLEEER